MSNTWTNQASNNNKNAKVSVKVGKGIWSKAVKKDISKKINLCQGKSVGHFKIIAENRKAKKMYKITVKSDIVKHEFPIDEDLTQCDSECEHSWVPGGSIVVTANDVFNGIIPSGFKVVALYADYCLTCYYKNILVITACARYEDGLIFTGNERYITGGNIWGDTEYAAHMAEHMSIGETGQGFTGNMWVLENISSSDIAGFWREGGGQIDASKTISVL